MWNGYELALGTWKDIWEQIKKVLVDYQKKERKQTYRTKMKYTNNLKNPVTIG